MQFHFNFSDATRTLPDLDGADFPDLPAAMEEARLSARELLGLDRGGLDSSYAGGRFSITDAAGTIIGVILFDEASLD